jgi:hypothetical protein
VCRFYSWGWRDVLSMPASAFRVFLEQAQRLSAEEDLRRLNLALVAQHGGDEARTLAEDLRNRADPAGAWWNAKQPSGSDLAAFFAGIKRGQAPKG